MIKAKKFIIVPLIILIIVLLTTSVSASKISGTVDIYDFPGCLSEDQYNALITKAQRYADKYGLDLVFVITANTDGKDSQPYADDFYDGENPKKIRYKDDGILFLIIVEQWEEDYIGTTGRAITQITDREIKWILEETRSVPAEMYFNRFTTMLDRTMYYYEDTTDNYSNQNSFNFFGALIYGLAGVLLSLVITIPTYFVLKKNKIQKHNVANIVQFYDQYTVGDGLYIVNKAEKLMDTQTHVRRGVYAVNRTSSGRSSGGSFHGGSSHSSSSGRSHGGGGSRR